MNKSDAVIKIKITPDAWNIICEEKMRGQLLDAVENGNESEFLYSLGISAVSNARGVITFGVNNDRP